MRITNLTLANFRSFGKEQTIEFAPLTLLFGPNSVGKSTVLMALFYVQQILAKGQCDPQRIDAMGGRYVGGFKHLVRGKNLEQPLKIGIEFEIGDELGSSYAEVGDLGMFDAEVAPITELSGIAQIAKTMSVDLEIRWSEQRKRAYVSCYKVAFDGIALAQIDSDSGLEQPMITEINYLHKLWMEEDLPWWVVKKLENLDAIHPFYGENFTEKYFDQTYAEFSQDAFHSELHELTGVPPKAIELSDQGHGATGSQGLNTSATPLGIKGFAGALVKPGKLLKTSLLLDDDFQNRVVAEILSDIVVAPLDNLLKLLNESLCIGPLRHISDATYQPNSFPEQRDWYSGRACWDELSSCDVLRDSMINEWLSDKDKLNLGYKLVYKSNNNNSRYVLPSRKISSIDQAVAMFGALGDELKITLSAEDLNENPTAEEWDISRAFEGLSDLERFRSSLDLGEISSKDTAVALWDCKNHIEVTAGDIGVGVSQLLPLVVAGVVVENGLVACEQPELHVHPRVQVAIGDLLLQAAGEKNFLIETHSEHIILRLLRRVRETSENSLPSNMEPVHPEDISIVYLEPSDDGVSVRRIQIDEDGEFKSRWPQGFFPERREELL